jgi:hypothetical protein
MTVTVTTESPKVAASAGVTKVSLEAGDKITIDANEKTSITAAAPPVIAATAIAKDDEISFDIDVAGTGAKGLIATILGTRP